VGKPTFAKATAWRGRRREMSKKKVLIIGSRAREHSLAWKLLQSDRVGTAYVTTPVNGGMRNLFKSTGKVRYVLQDAQNINKLIGFVIREKIDLTVVGSEDLLAEGIVDVFQKRGLQIFGPTCAASAIEASKVFSKLLMRANGIPTADFQTFQKYNNALKFACEHEKPVVIKADGLAGGKGVYLCKTLPEIKKALKDIMVDEIFGRRGASVVIEDFLDGPEISIHALCDTKTAILFPPSRDYKSLYEDGKGPNTGGMGSIAPVPGVTSGTMETVKKSIVLTALCGMIKCNQQFTGCLYPGLKLTQDGPKVLEFNARPGDPETQVYMRLLKTDLYDLLAASVTNQLRNRMGIVWRHGYAACIVLASAGYPGEYETGFPITGIEEAEENPNIVVFHAGTRYQNSLLVTSGGRVLNVTAIGDTLENAISQAYEAADCIRFKNKYYRKDIGREELQ